jgi:hypothetical protein
MCDTSNATHLSRVFYFSCSYVQVLETIRGEFPELKIVMADQLMFVKEDLIIPQHNTFYVSEQLCLFFVCI